MIVEAALEVAGPGALLVTRPAGVPHVYVGPLTPSGRYAAARGRTVCRARTRRLTVIPEHERWSSLDPSAPRLCARCSARLSRSMCGAGELGPTGREQWQARHCETTRADVAAALLFAEDDEEVAAAAHLSLLLFDYQDTLHPFEERGRSWPALHRLVAHTRSRFASEAEWARTAQQDALAADANDQRRREAIEIRKDRDDRITRLGFTNATAGEPRRRPPRPRRHV